MSLEFFPPLLELVRQAGEAILPYWRRELDVQQKADDSPVTAADLAANDILVRGLRTLAPEIPVLSEEACSIDLQTRRGWNRWWLVDPLDDTKEFIAGSEEFTVNVALIEQGRVVLGVVGIPASGVCFYGGAGLGAWRQAPGQAAEAIRVRPTPREGFTVVASKRHSSAAQQRLLEGLQARFGDLRLANIGSSLKLCLLAEGAADCYPRLAPTSQWDTAAAQGVLEGAGGELLDASGEPLDYQARADYLNPYFLALPAGADWRDTLVALAQQSAQD